MSLYDKFEDRSVSNAEKYTLRKELFGTEDVIPMWVADMDIATPTFVIDAIQKRLEHEVLGYEEFDGYESQINWLKRHFDLEIKKEWMFYSHSVVSSMNSVIEAFSEVGDEIIVQTPIYPPFFKSVGEMKRKLVTNTLVLKDGRFEIDFDDLNSKITSKTKLLLLCSPHNPSGRVFSKDELLKLANICLQNNIVIFSDEVHSDLVYGDLKHTPTLSLSEEISNITISAYGVGKTFNLSGMAISTIVIKNDELRKKFYEVYRDRHYAQGNVLAHTAFKTAYDNGDEWVKGLVKYLETNQNLIKEFALKHKDKMDYYGSEGTYLAWLDFRKLGLKDKALREFLIKEAKLGLSPGISFGKSGSGFMRLNFALVKSELEKALHQLDKALLRF